MEIEFEFKERYKALGEMMAETSKMTSFWRLCHLKMTSKTHVQLKNKFSERLYEHLSEHGSSKVHHQIPEIRPNNNI